MNNFISQFINNPSIVKAIGSANKVIFNYSLKSMEILGSYKNLKLDIVLGFITKNK